MTGLDRSFSEALQDFVKGPAHGSKTLAADLLSVTRPEVHSYLKGRMPRNDKRRRLESVMNRAGVHGQRPTREATVAEPAGGDVNDDAFRLIRYLLYLLEAERARTKS